MKVLNLLRYFLVFVVILAVQVGVLIQAKAQQKINDQLSENVKMLRDSLEHDNAVLEINCSLDWGINEGNPNYLKVRSANNKIVLTVYNAFRSNLTTVKAKKACFTDEGGTVVTYLIAEKGKLTIVDDYSRDPWSNQGLHLSICNNLIIGKYEKDESKNEIVFKQIFGEDLNAKNTRFTFSLECKAEKDKNSRRL